MRKYFLIFALLILSIGVFSGCKEDPSISCKVDKIEIYQNQELLLNSSYVLVENYEDGYDVAVKDNGVAKIVNKKIVPVNVGETKIVLSLKGYSEVRCEVDLVVKSGYIAEWIDRDHEVVKINKEINPKAVNKVYYNANCTETPIITYDNEVIDYDLKTGVITAKKIGETTVNIKFINCEISFKVNVTDVVYTESLIINETELFNNTTGYISFSKFPSNANTYRFWSKSKLLEIDEYGKYKTFNVGTATIYYQYYTGYNQLSSLQTFQVTIVDSSIEFFVSVLNENLESATNFMLDKKYNLVISCDNDVSSKLFSISNNIELLSQLSWVENYGYVAEFKFKSAGENIIDVYYTPKKDDLSLQTKQSASVSVYDENDVRVVAYWDVYPQEAINGKYLIFIDNNSYIADYLEFRLYLGGTLYYVDFQLYLEKDGDLVQISKIFAPKESGEYKIVAKIGDKILNTFTVIADYE